jgi:hypothetical protein
MSYKHHSASISSTYFYILLLPSNQALIFASYMSSKFCKDFSFFLSTML